MSEVVARSSGILCPLLSALPVEIRIQIYDYVLFENGNFFSLDDEEGNSVPTLFPKLRAPPRPSPHRKQHLQQTLEPPAPSAAADPRDASASLELTTQSPRGGNIVSLLLTSKQVYREASSHLYSRAFFRLRGIHSTVQFINAVEPAHLALVRSLKLVWDDQGWSSAPEFDTPTLRAAWPSLCDALATQFPGLESLYVALSLPSNEASVEALYLDELRRVRQPRLSNFKVCIPMGLLARYYGTKGHEHDEEDDDLREERERVQGRKAPFALCRHTAGEVCQVRREVIAAEWLGESRPSTPALKEVHHVPPHWDTNMERDIGGHHLKGAHDDDDDDDAWLDAVISGKL